MVRERPTRQVSAARIPILPTRSEIAARDGWKRRRVKRFKIRASSVTIVLFYGPLRRVGSTAGDYQSVTRLLTAASGGFVRIRRATLRRAPTTVHSPGCRRVGDELVIRGNVRIAEPGEAVIGIESSLDAGMRQSTVPDQDPQAAHIGQWRTGGQASRRLRIVAFARSRHPNPACAD